LVGGTIVAAAAFWYAASYSPSTPSIDGNPIRTDDPRRNKIRLVVLVIFDQMRGDYLSRWRDLFEADGGFRRMMREGVWFDNCHYPYANTKTGAGHASLATGTSPATHGIISNDWYEIAIEKEVYCVGTDRYDRVPTTGGKIIQPTEKKKAGRTRGASPDRLLSPTFADELKKAFGDRAKVVAVSLKDRSAVLPAGRKPDACYWFDSTIGSFVTSTFYRDGLHPWADAFNKTRSVDRFWRKDWDRLRPSLDYEPYSSKDDQDGENSGVKQGRTFPHPTDAGLDQLGPKYYDAVAMSPFGNQILLDFAKTALEAEQLGQDDLPDFLSISFSSNDLVGHCWGPDSQEVLDVTLRSDLVVKELLDHLDARVGRGRYLLALTSDHGVCPLPELTRARGGNAERIDLDKLLAEANAHLRARFTQSGGNLDEEWIEAEAEPWLYLSRSTLRRHQADQVHVEAALAEFLANHDGIQAAYTRSQITANDLPNDAIARRVVKSFHPDRAGDVYALLKPNYLFSSAFGRGTTHGTPHPYDTHVPLLVFGPGVKPGVVLNDETPPQAVVPIFAKALGIAAPKDCDIAAPTGMFAD
jgi:predicted AlkP superfamily pyrophosphatase or phosphodiesterase